MARAKVAAQLDARLLAVERHLDARKTGAACGQLGAFSHKLSSERKKGLPEPVSDAWVQKADAIGAAIGCK